MRLTKDCIGKKIRMGDWPEKAYFLPLAVTSLGHFIGENKSGEIDLVSINEWLESEDWEPYTEPKPKVRIEAAPAVAKVAGCNKLMITSTIYSSYIEAKNFLGDTFIFWPVKIHPVKGVFYWESE